MQAVRPGDLYFLDSPIHTDKRGNEESAQVKRLSYLLGTCSSRPAVVIRGPMWWDRFNTVTVLPALSKGEPAISFKLMDRYGNEGEAEYRFIPHNPHTIPVSRLGRYIGSLDHDELHKLMDAFMWINNPENFMSLSCPKCEKDNIPDVYKELFCKKPPVAWKVNRDARSDVIISLTDSGTIKSETNPEINGLAVMKHGGPPDIDEQAVERAIAEEPSFVPTSSPVPDAEKALDNEIQVPAEREFPESMFTKEQLNRVASRFAISDAYYSSSMEKRRWEALDDRIIRDMKAELTTLQFNEIRNIYDSMKPVDAYIFWPRLRADILSELSGISKSMAINLKKACNALRDMSGDEYSSRIKAYEDSLIPADPPKPKKEKKEDPNKISKEEIVRISSRVRNYMTVSKISMMPDDVARDFLKLSMGICKRLWSGPNFKTAYASAKAAYKNKFGESEIRSSDL